MGLKKQRGLMVAIDTHRKEDYERLKNVLPSVAELDKNIVLMPGLLPMLKFGSDFTNFLQQYDNKKVFNAKVAEDDPRKANKMLNLCKENEWDGIIVHGFLHKNVIRNLVENSGDVDVIAVVRMSSKNEFYDAHYRSTAIKVADAGVNGVVVGANHVKSIREVRGIVDGIDDSIYECSPGIGKEGQGADADSALKNGTDYLIIGRSILEVDDPRKRGLEYLDKLASYC